MTRLSHLLKHEAAGGILLLAAALAAMLLANSPAHGFYEALLHTHLTVTLGGHGLDKSLHHWINDGLMAVFFLLVGLEIKRESMEGALATLSQAALPLAAAVGGMAAPAVVYLAFSRSDPNAMAGWAIPAATDIAFALGVLALAGKAAPPGLRVFLLALAIMDDLGAILIIAFFYGSGLSPLALGLAGLATLGLILLNRFGVRALAPYVLTGIVLWACVLESGVHATLAGVVLGLAIPLKRDESGHAPLTTLEHGLHPWVTYGVLPLFAFANAGVSLAEAGGTILGDAVTLGIAAGLVIGKPLGVLATSFTAIALGMGRLPEGVRLPAFGGMAALTGIGFTMSLFIGGLAFPEGDRDAAVRVGVLGGSCLSALLGWGLLHLAGRNSEG